MIHSAASGSRQMINKHWFLWLLSHASALTLLSKHLKNDVKCSDNEPSFRPSYPSHPFILSFKKKHIFQNKLFFINIRLESFNIFCSLAALITPTTTNIHNVFQNKIKITLLAKKIIWKHSGLILLVWTDAQKISRCWNHICESRKQTSVRGFSSPFFLFYLSQLHTDKKQISVGFIGYPNVGKSSVINTLRSKKVCNVAPIAGETKVNSASLIRQQDTGVSSGPGMLWITTRLLCPVLKRAILRVDWPIVGTTAYKLLTVQTGNQFRAARPNRRITSCRRNGSFCRFSTDTEK